MAQGQMYWAFVAVLTNFINNLLHNVGVGREALSLRGGPPGRGEDNVPNSNISFTSNSHFLGQGERSARLKPLMSAAMGIPL